MILKLTLMFVDDGVTQYLRSSGFVSNMFYGFRVSLIKYIKEQIFFHPNLLIHEGI